MQSVRRGLAGAANMIASGFGVCNAAARTTAITGCLVAAVAGAVGSSHALTGRSRRCAKHAAASRCAPTTDNVGSAQSVGKRVASSRTHYPPPPLATKTRSSPRRPCRHYACDRDAQTGPRPLTMTRRRNPRQLVSARTGRKLASVVSATRRASALTGASRGCASSARPPCEGASNARSSGSRGWRERAM
jgi:hypothetical protein